MNGFDVEAYCDTAKLGLAVATLRILGVDAENPVPVAVKGQRCAVRLHMLLEGQKIGPCCLSGRKLQGCQTVRRIVNKDNQCAARASAFKPVMGRSVNLDQLAKARPALTQLKHPLFPAALGAPQFVFDLQQPHTLVRNRYLLALTQLLGGKRWSKALIWPLQQDHDIRLSFGIKPPW